MVARELRPEHLRRALGRVPGRAGQARRRARARRPGGRHGAHPGHAQRAEPPRRERLRVRGVPALLRPHAARGAHPNAGLPAQRAVVRGRALLRRGALGALAMPAGHLSGAIQRELGLHLGRLVLRPGHRRREPRAGHGHLGPGPGRLLLVRRAELPLAREAHLGQRHDAQVPGARRAQPRAGALLPRPALLRGRRGDARGQAARDLLAALLADAAGIARGGLQHRGSRHAAEQDILRLGARRLRARRPAVPAHRRPRAPEQRPPGPPARCGQGPHQRRRGRGGSGCRPAQPRVPNPGAQLRRAQRGRSLLGPAAAAAARPGGHLPAGAHGRPRGGRRRP
mmetsp:Transcript_10203/g.28824  ORF Transcript_10203/g.28824 Transcript_10203/m.28824 type:complete len:340 (-) Transcript_10203:218-1237(-)